MKRDPISGLITDGEATIIAAPKPDILTAEERALVEDTRNAVLPMSSIVGRLYRLAAIIDRIAPKPRT